MHPQQAGGSDDDIPGLLSEDEVSGSETSEDDGYPAYPKVGLAPSAPVRGPDRGSR